MTTAGIGQLTGVFIINAVPYGKEHIVILFTWKCNVQ